MQTSGHNVAPSISSITGAGMAGFGSAAAAAASTEATPPSQALANANAASAAAAAAPLQERPKYVYGQVPEATTAAQQEADEHVAAEASNGCIQLTTPGPGKLRRRGLRQLRAIRAV